MTRCVLILAAIAFPLSGVSAQDSRGLPRILLDRRLHERAVNLSAIDDKSVVYTDASGVTRTDVLSDYLAILPPPDRASPRPIGVLELADGQRFVGSLARTKPASPDSLVWDQPALGALEFNLDQVRIIQLQGGPTLPTRRPGEDTTDLVFLVNGDRLEGFVDAIGPVITIDAAGAAREIESNLVQSIILGAVRSPPPRPGMLAWLADGSIIACRALETTRTGDLIITPRSAGESPEKNTEAPGPTLTIRLDDLWALEVQPRTLQPLASLPFLGQHPGPGRRWTRPVESIDPRWSALGLADVEIPGPMIAEWELPPGASRFAADAELPRQMWTWGDCEVVVSALAASETELWRKRLTAESPRARVAVPLPAGAKRLRIRIEAGQYGAVQDKVILRRPVISVMQ